MVVPSLTLIYDRKGQATKSKTGVVELRICAGSVRKYISTGVKLLPREWKNGSVTGREDMMALNRQLQSLVKKCSEIITKMMEEDNIDVNAIPNILKDRLNQKQTFLEYVKEKAKQRSKSLRVGTQKRYKVVLDFLEEWNGIVYFADVTEKNIQKMDDCLVGRGLKENSRWNYHKILKIFVTQAFNENFITKNPYTLLNIGKGEEDGIQRHLTPEEFYRFKECQIDDKCLGRVRDVFVFQTYTCMGYSDLEAFDYKKCTKEKGQVVYRSTRVKTGQPFTVVLLKPALAILKKYKYKLPIISNVKYNLYLKAAVKYAKIDKQVTTHWARHTGATLLINEDDVPMHIVQHILGHSTIRETEKTYAKVMDKKIVETMANIGKVAKVLPMKQKKVKVG
jgi:integrase